MAKTYAPFFIPLLVSALLFTACGKKTASDDSRASSRSQQAASSDVSAVSSASSLSGAAPGSQTTQTLRKGNSGAAVTELQQKLTTLGYSCGADGTGGTFGADTADAVTAFQLDHNLTGDGVAGTRTWAALADAAPSEASSPAQGANPYFFAGASSATYHGTFAFPDDVETDVSLKIEKLAAPQTGTLYHLVLGSVADVPANRLDIGYFFVEPDRIYRVYDAGDDIKKLESNGTVPDGSPVVCQEKALPDALGSAAKGWHQSIKIDGDKRRYESYNDTVDTGYYDNITWERGKGIVHYESGYGAGRDSIELDLKS